MQTQAESLMRSLPEVPMDATLRAKALELSAELKDTSNRVMFELALLQSELGEGNADARQRSASVGPGRGDDGL